MRKILLVILMAVCVAGVAFAANKISASGSPNESGVYPVEIFDDRSVVIEDLTVDSIQAESAKITAGINWTDANLFQQAYSGINWTDKPHICMSATGVMSADADGTCP